MAKKPIILVDGSSYLYRAFHALPPLTNSKNEPTGAIYGVVNMLRKMLQDYQPEQMAVIFDPKGKTFRDDLYPQYKANRPPMPDDLRCQIEPLFKIINAMGLPLIIIDHVEADDVIGTFATMASNQKTTMLISTGDKDMAQLVNEHVTLINTMNNKISDRQGVIDKFGIPPELIIDYLALVGDKVDNVPGVPKCGPKTAVKWLNEYGSLQGVIDNADKVKGKVGEYLRDSLENLPLSQQLVTIKCDVEMAHTLSDLTIQGSDKAALTNLFQDLEFKTWLNELLSTREETSAPANYEIITTESALKTWLKRLTSADYFSFDTETTSLDYMQAEIVGVSFAVQSGEAAYVPLAHDYEDAPEQLSRDHVLALLKPLLEAKDAKIIGQNLKYDMSVLARYDIKLNAIAADTMLQSYVLNSSSNRHDMDTLALKYLGKNTIHYEDIAGKGAKQLTFNQINIDQAGPYAAEDADITLQLHQTLWPKITEEQSLTKVYQQIELPLVSILSKIERNGVLLDAQLLSKLSQQFTTRIEHLQAEAFEIAGKEFNLASPKQLQEILFVERGLPVLQKTPSGQPSTAEAVLEELALDYPLPKIILEFRSLSKLKTTYTDKLPRQIDKDSGRVHTSYHQAVTSTGRLSSSDPNLQNIPIRTEEGRKIRQAFIARAGYQIVAADYSQIELRIMAHLSADESLVNAFANGLDIHQATASEIFNCELAKVTSDQRRSAKAINFGLIYGMSAFGLSKQLGIQRKDAQAYMDLYFSRYPGVKDYMENTRQLAHEQSYVETLSGRRLYLAEINSRNFQRQRAAERAAINAPMQGTAADIIKLAMIDIDQWLANNNLDITMIMQVHDELVFEVHEDCLEQACQEIEKLMINAFKLKVPLAVAVGHGQNWDEAH